MSDSANNCGTSLPGMLLVLFVGLRLTGHIEWCWLWVLSPAWITALVLLAFFATAYWVGSDS